MIKILAQYVISLALIATASSPACANLIEVLAKGGHTEIYNNAPVDAVFLIERLDRSSRSLEHISISARSSRSIGAVVGTGIRDIRFVLPSARIPVPPKCSTLGNANNLGGVLAAAIESIETNATYGLSGAVDLMRDSAMEKMQAASLGLEVAVDDPLWDEIAAYSQDIGDDYSAARQTAFAEQQRQDAALMAFGEMSQASMAAEDLRLTGFEIAAEELAVQVQRADNAMQSFRRHQRSIERQVDSLMEFEEDYTHLTTDYHQAGLDLSLLGRMCQDDAMVMSSVLLKSSSEHMAKLRVKFDRGGSINVTALPTSNSPDTLIAQIPIPLKATSAKFRYGKVRLGEVVFRDESVTARYKDLKRNLKRLKRAYREMLYKADGGDTIDTGVVAW